MTRVIRHAIEHAPLDFIIPFEGLLRPLEVKSGKTGTLKSLHQFMEKCEHSYAIRLYANNLHLETIKTQSGKEFTLLNLPYYLAGQIDKYMSYYFGSAP